MISEADRMDAQAKEKAMGEMSQLHTQNLNKQVREAVPMPIVAGPVPRGVNGVAPSVTPEDPVFVEKTKHLRRKGETIFAFCARTQVGLDQIRTLSRRDLEKLIKVKSENADEVTEPKRPAKLIPDHLRVTFDASGNLDAHLAPKLPGNMIDTNDVDSYWDRVQAARE